MLDPPAHRAHQVHQDPLDPLDQVGHLEKMVLLAPQGRRGQLVRRGQLGQAGHLELVVYM